jgi:diacylglycerol kinase (ATP)
MKIALEFSFKYLILQIMKSPYKGKTGLRRLINAFGYSIAGTLAAFKHEDAFRQEVILSAILIPLALYLGQTGIEQALMIASIILVIIVELLNSSLEATVDRISVKRHKLAKRAKDIGSAAVFFSLINATVIWFLILVK